MRETVERPGALVDISALPLGDVTTTTADGGLEGVRMRDIVGRARADLRPGDRVHLSVRPEAIRIRERGEASGGSEDGVVTLPASVTDVIYAGNICDVFMDAGGVPLRAQVTPADFERLAIGDGVVAAFDTRSKWPVPADDEVAAVDDESAGIDPTVPQPRIEVTA